MPAMNTVTFSILRRARLLAFGTQRPCRRSADSYQWGLWRMALADIRAAK